MNRIFIKTFILLLSYQALIVTGQNTINLASSIRFLQIADYGGTSNPPFVTASQVKAVSGMNKVAQEIKAGFIIALGDLFYDFGVRDVNDERFNTTWRDVYLTGESKNLHIPWYLVAGKLVFIPIIVYSITLCRM